MPPKCMFKYVNQIIDMEIQDNNLASRKSSLELKGSKRRAPSESCVKSISAAKGKSVPSLQKPIKESLNASPTKRPTRSYISDEHIPIADAFKKTRNLGKSTNGKGESNRFKKNVHPSSKGKATLENDMHLDEHVRINEEIQHEPRVKEVRDSLNANEIAKGKYVPIQSDPVEERLSEIMSSKSTNGKGESNRFKKNVHPSSKGNATLENDMHLDEHVRINEEIQHELRVKEVRDSLNANAIAKGKYVPIQSDPVEERLSEIMSSLLATKREAKLSILEEGIATGNALKKPQNWGNSTSSKGESSSLKKNMRPNLKGNVRCNKRISVPPEDTERYGDMCRSPLYFDMSDEDRSHSSESNQPKNLDVEDDQHVQGNSDTTIPDITIEGNRENIDDFQVDATSCEDDPHNQGPSKSFIPEGDRDNVDELHFDGTSYGYLSENDHYEDEMHTEDNVEVNEEIPEGSRCEKDKRNTRGCMTYEAVATKDGEKRVCIIDRQLGVPVGDERQKLATWLGLYARRTEYFPIEKRWGQKHQRSFENVMQKLKDDFEFVMEDGKTQAPLDGVLTTCKRVLQQELRTWRCNLKHKYYDDNKTQEEQASACKDKRIHSEKWTKLMQYWGEERTKNLSAAIKKIRNIVRPTYTHGPVCFASHRYKQKNKHLALEIYVSGHLDKKLNFKDKETKDIVLKVIDACIKRGLDKTRDPMKFQSLLDEVIGKHRGGYERGFGGTVSRRDMHNRRAKEVLHGIVTELQQQLHDTSKELEVKNRELAEANSRIAAMEGSNGNRNSIERRNALRQEIIRNLVRSSKMLQSSTPPQSPCSP